MKKGQVSVMSMLQVCADELDIVEKFGARVSISCGSSFSILNLCEVPLEASRFKCLSKSVIEIK